MDTHDAYTGMERGHVYQLGNRATEPAANGVYFCRNKYDDDDDDELRSILKLSHTGPAKAVRVGDGYYPLPG